MKWACATLVFLASAIACRAESIAVADSSKTMPDVAQTTTEILVNAQLPIRAVGKDSYVIEARNIHCDRRNTLSSTYTSDPTGGFSLEKCRLNAKDEMDTTSGEPFDSAILNSLDTIEANSKLTFFDCGMRYCGVFLTSIVCTIHTDKPYEGGGRWACTFDAGR